MKFIQTVLNVLSAILVFGGTVVIGFTYLTNKPFISYLSSILTNAQFGSVMKRVLYGGAAIIIGLLIFTISLRIGSAIRRKDRQRRQEEKERQAEIDAQNRQLREDAKQARAEAEAMKKEAEEAKARLQTTSEFEKPEE